MKNDCIIPVFSKDNETTISHADIIETTNRCVMDAFQNSELLFPDIRISHTVKGRVANAIRKPAKDLLEHEKTIYYERMMFVIEVPSITKTINGNKLNLVVGGVRAYNQENLYSRKTIEKFKVFIGFQNMVCCNLCVSTDGLMADIRVSSIEELYNRIESLICNYEMQTIISDLQDFSNYVLTERQFAQFIGRLRMYQFILQDAKKNIAHVLLNDGQVNTIARQYYRDEHFIKQLNGEIGVWNVYNLLTGAVKSSYIDSFIDRNLNAYTLCKTLINSLNGSKPSWFLS